MTSAATFPLAIAMASAIAITSPHSSPKPVLPATIGRTVSGAAMSAPAVDSIYALAVDSAAYRAYPFVYLLDEGTIRLEADGRGSRTYRQVVQILKPAGVARWAEQRVAYQPDREKVTVNWMRVVRPSGEVISDKPTLSQTSDVAASTVNPVYTETKVIRYSLGDVAPGTLVDLSWTIETTKPPLAGDMLSGWSFSLGTPGLRSRFVLDVPDATTPHIVETHLNFARSEIRRDGRHIFTWATHDVQPPKSELFAPDSSVPSMGVRVGAPMTWSEIGQWYNGLAKNRYVLTPALTAEVDSIVRSARTASDTINVLHRWIANDLRYVSVSLGIGGYQPRFPEATVSTGYGDCKDKATLFIAAARHLGITAYPVLLNSEGGTDRSLPALEQFDHVIAAVPHPGPAGFTFLDLTTNDFPDGEIPPSYQGGFGLVVLPDGSTRDVTFPKDSAGSTEEVFAGGLTADGKVSGTLTLTAHGSSAEAMRAAFATPPDSAHRANLKRSAPKPFPNATVDTMMIDVPANRDVTPTIEYVFRDGDGAKPAGPLSILTIPSGFRGSPTAFSNVIEALQRNGARKLPIDASRTLGQGTVRRELRLDLPPGWNAQLPDSVHAAGPFGTYIAQYTQVGRELRIVHTTIGGSGVYPPSSVGALIDWFKAISKDDAEYIPLTRGS
jgi:hypothetical protein